MIDNKNNLIRNHIKNQINNQNLEQPITLKISKIVDEAKDIKTFIFEHNLNAKPGQFVMLWIPRVNQKPFGVSYQDKDKFGITVCKVGKFTEELFKKKEGDYLGIQGPYGKPFTNKSLQQKLNLLNKRKKRIILIAGGYGSAPLAFFADELIKQNNKIQSLTFFIGAKNKSKLTYKNRFQKTKINMIYSTEDGSFGSKGFATDALDCFLKKEKVDMIYCVGPESMMKKVIEISDKYNIDCEISLERYMKCGFGICGQCSVDGSGVCICKEGPIFDKEYIKKNIKEFGKYHRDGTGKKHFLDNIK